MMGDKKMDKCDCIKKLEEKLSEQLERPQLIYNIFSGKTFSTVSYNVVVRGKTKQREIMVTHIYCPWCGVKYD